MYILSIKTRKILPPKDDIYKILDEYCPKLVENDVFFITSKALAISQGKCIKINSLEDKEKLVKKHADKVLGNIEYNEKKVYLTIKNNTIIPSSGIDESNGNGYYILWPDNPSQQAQKICSYLKEKNNISNFAIIIIDSTLIPLRNGTIGISIGSFGIEPIKDYKGQKDIFENEMKMTQLNIIDSLSALAGLYMGEGSEQTPFLILRDFPSIEFTNKQTHHDLLIDKENDLYYPLYK